MEQLYWFLVKYTALNLLPELKEAFAKSSRQLMTGRKNRALEVPPVTPYKALENFSKALYGTTRGTCSARFFRPVMQL